MKPFQNILILILIPSVSYIFIDVVASQPTTNITPLPPPMGWWHISVTPGYGTRFPDFTPLQSAPHPLRRGPTGNFGCGAKKQGWVIFSAAASGGGLVALAAASNTSHGITGHPCAGASGLQGPDDLSPLRTPLSESGFAAGAANDRVAFGERRRFGCSHIFYVFGLKLSESGNWSRSGCNMWYVRWQRWGSSRFWGVISRIGWDWRLQVVRHMWRR